MVAAGRPSSQPNKRCVASRVGVMQPPTSAYESDDGMPLKRSRLRVCIARLYKRAGWGVARTRDGLINAVDEVG